MSQELCSRDQKKVVVKNRGALLVGEALTSPTSAALIQSDRTELA